jgi:hypothetical protein
MSRVQDAQERLYLHGPGHASRPVPDLTFFLTAHRFRAYLQTKKMPAHRTGMLIWWTV